MPDIQETATPNATAVTAESAPATETVETPAVNAETSAPSTEVTTEENIEVEGAKPSKAVSELIAQRKKRQAAEMEAAYLRGQLEVLRKPEQAQQPVVTSPNQLPDPPSLDNFETFEEYEQAKDEYLVSKARHQMRLEFQEQQRQVQVKQVQTSFEQKLAAEELKDPHIRDRAVTVGNMVTPVVADMVVQSDISIDLVRHLEANPQDARRISAMPPLMAARELGMIEAQIKYKPVPVAPKKVSAAPEPIPTVAPAGAGVVDEDNLPIDEWIARRNEKMQKRR